MCIRTHACAFTHFMYPAGWLRDRLWFGRPVGPGLRGKGGIDVQLYIFYDRFWLFGVPLSSDKNVVYSIIVFISICIISTSYICNSKYICIYIFTRLDDPKGGGRKTNFTRLGLGGTDNQVSHAWASKNKFHTHGPQPSVSPKFHTPYSVCYSQTRGVRRQPCSRSARQTPDGANPHHAPLSCCVGGGVGSGG